MSDHPDHVGPSVSGGGISGGLAALRTLGRAGRSVVVGHDLMDATRAALLGAAYLQLGDFDSGHDWYQKAETLGAKRATVDQDIRGVLARCAPNLRDDLSRFLMSRDAVRFAWLKTPTPRQRP